MSSCLKCGTIVSHDAQTCAMCGATLETQPATNDSLPPVLLLKKQRTSGFAIAASLLGIASIIPVFTPFALACGIIALVQIGNRQRLLRGKDLAICGMVCSILVPVLLGDILSHLFDTRPREKARQTVCTSHQRQIALAIVTYPEKHEEIMPGKLGLTSWSSMAEKQLWRTKDIQIAAGLFDCKSSGLTGAPGLQAEYGMNADVMGVKLEQIVVPEATLLTADTKGVDAIFSASDIAARHNDGFIASFADGHCQYIKDTLYDPPQTTLRTAADYITLPPPAINKLIIQGATNVIEIKLHDWHDNPICHVHSGKKLTTWIGKNGYLGAYITAYYSELPKKGKPRDITIGTFTNGANGSPTRLVMPAAGGVPKVFATYWLPPVIGHSPAAGHPTYTGYCMIGGQGKGVSIVPVVQ